MISGDYSLTNACWWVGDTILICSKLSILRKDIVHQHRIKVIVDALSSSPPTTVKSHQVSISKASLTHVDNTSSELVPISYLLPTNSAKLWWHIGKVCGPYRITLLDWTSTIEQYIARLLVKSGHWKYTWYDKQWCLYVLGPTFHMIGGAYAFTWRKRKLHCDLFQLWNLNSDSETWNVKCQYVWFTIVNWIRRFPNPKAKNCLLSWKCPQ